MSKCEQCDSIIPIIMFWEKPTCEAFMRCLDVDEFAELNGATLWFNTWK